MLVGKCFMDGCMIQPRGKCDCNNTTTLFCDLHALDHIKSPSWNGHFGQSLYFKPSEETKSVTAKRILSLITDLHKFKANFLLQSNLAIDFLLEAIQNTLIRLNKIDQECKNIMQISLSDVEILDVPTESNIEKILKLTKEEAEVELESWEVPECVLGMENIEFFIKKNFKVKLEIFKDLGNVCKSNIIWFFENHGTINIYNLDNAQVIPQPDCFDMSQMLEISWKNSENIKHSKRFLNYDWILKKKTKKRTKKILLFIMFYWTSIGLQQKS
ncbi:unnamed protein product [Blepharisma stoltei]|uniref:Uncharacterized protein n=1 Tax=Blepharisma stoltei TaxID=1481888 RepID=A0AAU9K4R7_9CILI|nr:unnamed protein product [Blepharisma stoltei]